MKKLLTLFFLACFWAWAQAKPAPAGRVVLVIGNVFVERDGVTFPLRKNDEVWAGERISTRQGSHAYLRMQDGGLLVLRPASTLEIQVFDYDPANPAASRVRYKLQGGVARTVTGAVGQANKEAFRFNTPLAAIGVRGTDFVASSDERATLVSVSQGAVVVAPFSVTCLAEGFGPCLENAITLRAGEDRGYVRISVDEPLIPRLEHDQKFDPNKIAPPRPEEPLALHLQEQRVGKLEEVEQSPKLPANIHWGRWNPALVGIAGPTVAELLAQHKTIHIANFLFGLGVAEMPQLLPERGSIAFVLGGGDAYVRARSGEFAKANLLDGTLAVDFARRDFAAQARLSEQGNIHELQAAGPVDHRGYLIADPVRSNTQLDSVLSADLKTAGSLFTRPLHDGRTLIGSIYWQR